MCLFAVTMVLWLDFRTCNHKVLGFNPPKRPTADFTITIIYKNKKLFDFVKDFFLNSEFVLIHQSIQTDSSSWCALGRPYAKLPALRCPTKGNC